MPWTTQTTQTTTLALLLLAGCAGELSDPADLVDAGGPAASRDAAAATTPDSGPPCSPTTYRLRHLQASMQRTDRPVGR